MIIVLNAQNQWALHNLSLLDRENYVSFDSAEGREDFRFLRVVAALMSRAADDA